VAKLTALWGRGLAQMGGFLDRVLTASGFWALSWWGQIFAVVFVILVALAVFLGPLILAAFRLFRSGDRPGVAGLLAILAGVVAAAMALPLLINLMEHVLDHHPGPVI